MKLNPRETELNGNWTNQGGDLVEDSVSRRISVLVMNHLQQVATDESGWDQLYLDPEDGRLWELLYLQSELQGGGPPTLRVVNAEDAKAKYGYEG